jgi:hypothetical protein
MFCVRKNETDKDTSTHPISTYCCDRPERAAHISRVSCVRAMPQSCARQDCREGKLMRRGFD